MGHDVDVDFAASPRELARVLEKNAFAVYGYDALRTFATMGFLAAALLGTLALAFVGAASGSLPALLPIAGFLLQSAPAARLARSAGQPAGAAPLLGVGLAILLVVVLRSATLALRRGGIRWRDTFYDLGTLRSARRALRAHAARLRAEARGGR